MKAPNPSDGAKDPQLRHGSGTEETIEVVVRNWRAEVETAQAYRDIAAREQDGKRKGILIRMAAAEERHAQRWEQKLRDLGAEPPVLDTSFRDSAWTNRSEWRSVSPSNPNSSCRRRLRANWAYPSIVSQVPGLPPSQLAS